MSFRRGVPGEFAAAGPDAKFTAASGLRKGRKVSKTATGTVIRFWPDRQIFVPGADWSFGVLAEEARQTAYLVPGLSIKVTDERPERRRAPRTVLTAAEKAAAADLADGTEDEPDDLLADTELADDEPGADDAGSDDAGAELVPGETGATARRAAIAQGQREAEFRFVGGISEFCAHLSVGEPVTDVVRLPAPATSPRPCRYWTSSGTSTPTDVERQLDVDIALRWDTGYETTLRSFVNVIATVQGRHARHRLRAGPGAHGQRPAEVGQGAQGRRRAGDQG